MKRVGWSGIGKVGLVAALGWAACQGKTAATKPDAGTLPDAAGGAGVDGSVADLGSDVGSDGKASGGASSGGASAGGASAGGASAGGGAVTGGRGGGGGAGGASGGGGGGGASAPPDPFAGVMMKPDVSTMPVADCTGQPDLTLCNVLTTPDRWYDICVGGKCVSPGCGDPSCNVPAPHFSIPANSNHEHLQVLPGPEPIVVDLVTGLHWQGCDAGRSGETCATGASQDMRWSEALAYCDALVWGGKDDWYLPDEWELMSIDDWAKKSDQYSLDPVAFPHPSNWYWSTHFSSMSTIYATQYRGASDKIIDNGVSGTYDVRCVRRGFSRNAVYTGERFTRGAGTLTDAATGLMWQRCQTGRSGTTTCAFNGTTPTEYPASQAVGYCDALVAGGFDDWRLPTFKELHSTVVFPPRTSGDPEIIDLDSYKPYLLCRSGWEPDARVLLMRARDSNPIIPNDASTYPIICVRGY